MTAARVWIGLGVIALGVCVVILWQKSSSDNAVPPPVSQERKLPPEPGKPERYITPDGQPARVVHKNAAGLSPHEVVHTPEGPVTIRRTYRSDGTLLTEEATLNGKPVPVPSR